MRKTAPCRLLLLEFLCHRDDRCESSMFYPYLKGVARDRGAASLWLFFVAKPRFSWERPVGRTLRADLPDEDVARLERRLKSFRPTHVVCNEIPAPRLRAVIAAAGVPHSLVLPGDSDLMSIPWGIRQEEMEPYLRLLSDNSADRRFIHRPAWFADWLGAGRHPREQENLVDATDPDFEAVQANGAVDFKPSFPMILVGGQSCMGRPTVAGNPRFRDLPGRERLPPGCSFCGGLDEKTVHRYHRQDSLELAERQLRALTAVDPRRSRSRGVYMVHDLGLFMRIDAFFRMLHQNNFPPAKFIFCPRIDDVLGARERIASILPLAAERGHRIAFDIMGLENFCPETMALYNKNISVAQADELAALMDRWHRDWPKVFAPFHGGKNWLMLLFTPWTTLAELKVNYEAAAQRGFDSDQYWICTSLLLRRGSSLAALAEQEGGIIVPEFPDRGQMFFPICGMPAMWDSIPWRFRDERVADFFRILIRIFVALVRPDAGPLFAGDPEFALFARIYCDQPADSAEPLRRPPWALLDAARVLL
ncbi:MAG: hypothetical protein PHU21_13765, partial [Elusimicrobia bacterium]|nr:hypothetical protein [Elusimicrobiota bacterium]